MPAPSELSRVSASVRRFLNDERGYREELAKEETAIQDLEEKIRTGNCDENATYVLKQQKTAAGQTKAMVDLTKKELAKWAPKLEEQIAASEVSGKELDDAKEILDKAKASLAGSQ